MREMPTLKEIRCEKARRNYIDYLEYVNGDGFIRAKHIEFLANAVQEFIEDPNNKKKILCLSMPPQHGKSMTISESLSSWFVGKNIGKSSLILAYGEDLAKDFGKANKEKLQLFGEEIFGVEIPRDASSTVDYEVRKPGKRTLRRSKIRSIGIMGGIAGKAGNLIVIDDPYKSESDAESETYRKRVWGEFFKGINARLGAKDKVIIIHTRWHEDDLIGRLTTEFGDKCEYINITCEAEEDDILGREPGEALFPEIGKDKKWKDEEKDFISRSDGSRAWLALYQGKPTSPEGNMLKREHWREYLVLPGAEYSEDRVLLDETKGMMQMIMSVDATFKDSKNSDNVAIQVWGKRNADMYLIDSFAEKIDFAATIKKIEEWKEKYPRITAIFIEDKANGPAIISMLSSKIPGIIPINPKQGKIARANAVTHPLRAGNLHVPKNAPWLGDFIEECSSFPHGKHDDRVDAMSQAINELMYMLADEPIIEVPFKFAFNSERPVSSGDSGGKVTVI